MPGTPLSTDASKKLGVAQALPVQTQGAGKISPFGAVILDKSIAFFE
jgi:hypothetical protein